MPSKASGHAIDGIRPSHRRHRVMPSMSPTKPSMALGQAIEGIEPCHQWYWVMPSTSSAMPSMVSSHAIDGIGSCHRWYRAMPSMVLGHAIDATDHAIDGIDHAIDMARVSLLIAHKPRFDASEPCRARVRCRILPDPRPPTPVRPPYLAGANARRISSRPGGGAMPIALSRISSISSTSVGRCASYSTPTVI